MLTFILSRVSNCVNLRRLSKTNSSLGTIETRRVHPTVRCLRVSRYTLRCMHLRLVTLPEKIAVFGIRELLSLHKAIDVRLLSEVARRN